MMRKLSTVLLLALVLVIISTAALAEFLVIDSVLGMRSKDIPGIGGMSQGDVAMEAALLALSVEGWDLAVYGAYLDDFGPPGWSGGIEWGVLGIPAAESDDWGYDVCEECAVRNLMFHTDDTVYRMSHDICEPSPLGVISGFMSSPDWFHCGVVDWGVFYIDTDDPVATTSSSWGLVKALYR